MKSVSDATISVSREAYDVINKARKTLTLGEFYEFLDELRSHCGHEQNELRKKRMDETSAQFDRKAAL